MAKIDQLGADLEYVRTAVQRSEREGSPRSIYVLWGCVILVGLPLVDFAPRALPFYWAVAGPLGGVISFVLGFRHAMRLGQGDRRVARRHALHWLGLLVAIGLIVPLAPLGVVAPEALSSVLLVVVALAYFLAGVHLDRRLLWIGLLMAAGHIVVLFMSSYVWTLIGVALALALFATALTAGTERDTRQA